MPRILSGIDHLLQHTSLSKKAQLALVTNDAATTVKGISTRLALVQAGFRVVKLFVPEHGLTGRGADGQIIYDGVDELTQLPFISLYGTQMSPTLESLQSVDLVMFDIPDVGCRFYTYLWTLTWVMEACKAFDIPIMVLDRPNPIGGQLNMVEGPMLEENCCASFLGRFGIPLRHSCTLGELAQYFAATRYPGIQLEVVHALGWKRHLYAGRDYPFVQTSPAISDAETALLYPGMGLFEGITVHEGRGTPFPFKQFGAPWLNADAIQRLVNNRIEGLQSIRHSYIPTEGPYAGAWCHGLQLTVTNMERFRPVAAGLSLIHAIEKLHPGAIQPRLYPTHANPSGRQHLDRLLGIDNALQKVRDASVFTDIAATWEPIIHPFLIYP